MAPIEYTPRFIVSMGKEKHGLRKIVIFEVIIIKAKDKKIRCKGYNVNQN